MRVLIVDDSAVLRKVIERALSRSGLTLSPVIEAANGQKALDTLREAQAAGTGFDLIISDINMPVMDGLVFLEQRQKESLATGVPVVVITSEDNATMVNRAAAAGANGYVCKPFTSEQISSRVFPLLDARHLPR